MSCSLEPRGLDLFTYVCYTGYMRKICTIQECGRHVTGHGYCSKHYQRFIKWGDPLFVTRRRGDEWTERACLVTDCANPGSMDSKTGRRYLKSGYCLKHYERLKKYGDPLFTPQVQDQGRKLHPLYGTYRHMRNRCYNVKPGHRDYKYWRGRGIKICDRWMDVEKGFWNFVEDMGPRPEGHSIDRVDPDGDYSPENCRWATARQQSRNRRNVKNEPRTGNENPPKRSKLSS